jgi:excisionase family DNA binding protein
VSEARLLTARELAEYLGLKPATVLDKWERGELPGFKFGRAVRFDLDEVLATGRPSPGLPYRIASGTLSRITPSTRKESHD